MTYDPGLVCRECSGEHLDKPDYACEEQRALNPPLLSSDRVKLFCRGRFAIQNEFESQVKSFEKEAQEKYHSSIQGMKEVKLPNWFHKLLESKIIPPLRRIGFDTQFARALFKMAADAWQLMGPISDEDIHFHPALFKDIEEIRRGTLEKAKRNSECLSLLAEVKPQDLRFRVQAGMGPRDLFSLLEDICTSWIILPRVYDHLEKHHSQCLLGYLKYLDSETNSEFRKVLARITIEFVGNYTLKYISEIHPRDSMVDGLFWGYAAMFWRNLRKPPEGFEDAGIFENFLHWAKMFRNRSASISRNMARMIESMEEAKEEALPNVDAFGLARDSSDDVGRFLVTLRHGHPGIKAGVRYFGIGGSLLKHATDGRLPYVSVPTALSAFFREVKRNYPMETSRTKKSIRQFLLKLRAEFDTKAIEMAHAGYEASEQLRFVGPRVLGIINDLTGAVS
jgi:hypothetical protein